MRRRNLINYSPIRSLFGVFLEEIWGRRCFPSALKRHYIVWHNSNFVQNWQLQQVRIADKPLVLFVCVCVMHIYLVRKFMSALIQPWDVFQILLLRGHPDSSCSVFQRAKNLLRRSSRARRNLMNNHWKRVRQSKGSYLLVFFYTFPLYCDHNADYKVKVRQSARPR